MAVETTPARPIVTDAASPAAEAIRLRLAGAWGAMGAAWGVAPAIARVHAYLMTRQAPLTEGGGREGLGRFPRGAGRGPPPRRARRRARAGRRAGASRGGLPGHRRPLAVARASRGGAEGPRGRSDHQRPGADGEGCDRGLGHEPRGSRPGGAPRGDLAPPRLRPALRPGRPARSPARAAPAPAGPGAPPAGP